MVKVAILGATGFSGEELVRILSSHPQVKISYLSSRTPSPFLYADNFPRFKNIVTSFCEPLDLKKVVRISDVIFCSLPHTVSMEYVPFLLKNNKKVIDLSADYRLSPFLYKKWYKKTHKDKKNLKKAVYGLSEFFKEEIKKTDLVANPGCYPTSIILALAPLLLENLIEKEVFVTSVSSITGAGRKPLIDYHYAHIENNFWAYKPLKHQHSIEIAEVLKKISSKKIDLGFIPQVSCLKRGIYSTIYAHLRKNCKRKDIFKIYHHFYKDAFFVRIKEDIPKLKDVIYSNFCDIGVALEEKKIVIFSCLDNLVKGASGNAVQNMNIMLGFDEKEGLL